MPVKDAGERVVGAVALALDAGAQGCRALHRPLLIGDARLAQADIVADGLGEHGVDVELGHVVLGMKSAGRVSAR